MRKRMVMVALVAVVLPLALWTRRGAGRGSEAPGPAASSFRASLQAPAGFTLRARLGELVAVGLEVSLPDGAGPREILAFRLGPGARRRPLLDLRIGYLPRGVEPDGCPGDAALWIPFRPRVALDLGI